MEHNFFPDSAFSYEFNTLSSTSASPIFSDDNINSEMYSLDETIQASSPEAVSHIPRRSHVYPEPILTAAVTTHQYTATDTSVNSLPVTGPSIIPPPLTFLQQDRPRYSGAVDMTTSRSPPSSTGVEDQYYDCAQHNPTASVKPHRAARKRPRARVRKREQVSVTAEPVDEDILSSKYSHSLSALYPSPRAAELRSEETRRKRIESDQRLRKERRDGFEKLKDVLPNINQQATKVVILDTAATYIQHLETTTADLQTRLNSTENELRRLRDINEEMMLTFVRSRPE